MVKKVIIDCDPGTDDAQAIIIALACDDIEIVAITTVFGNSSIENTTANTIRLLKYFKKPGIPIYKGCAKSLLFHRSDSNNYHGIDGLGDVNFDGIDPVDASCASQEHAAVALSRLVSEQPGSITLIALGPLTNVAVALMLDPQLGSKLKDCVIMGGNYLGKGNATASAEFNWFCDPEAAHCVLTGLSKPPTLLPYETCQNSSYTWDWYENATSIPSRSAQFVKAVDAYTVRLLRARNSPKYYAYDQLAVSVVIDPDMVLEAKEVHGIVELHGHLTRGQLVVDWNATLGKSPNVRIVTSVNQDRYEKIAFTAFNLN